MQQNSEKNKYSSITVGFSANHYIVDPMLLFYHRGTRLNFKCHEDVLSLQPIIPPKRLTFSLPDWGMLRRSRCVHVRKLGYIRGTMNN